MDEVIMDNVLSLQYVHAPVHTPTHASLHSPTAPVSHPTVTQPHFLGPRRGGGLGTLLMTKAEAGPYV